MNKGRATVIARDAEVPEVVKKVGVVRVTEIRLRVGGDRRCIEEGKYGNQIRATDHRHYGLDVRTSEGEVQVARAFNCTGPHHSGSWILNRHESEIVTDHFQCDLLNVGEDPGSSPRGRKNSDVVPGAQLRRHAQVRAAIHPATVARNLGHTTGI